MLVYTCTQGQQGQGTVTFSTQRFPTCDQGGTWIEQPEPFDATQYFQDHGPEWGQFFAAGFTFVAVVTLTGRGIRLLLSFIAR